MRLLNILLVTFPLVAHAISCPDNGSTLDIGQSLNSVLKECGPPLSQNNYNKKVILSQQWIYYKKVSNQNIKITFLLDNDTISNIEIFDSSQVQPRQNVNTSNVCGAYITSGKRSKDILAACGAPNTKIPLETQDIPVVELQYSGTNPNILIFENANLVDWK